MQKGEWRRGFPVRGDIGGIIIYNSIPGKVDGIEGKGGIPWSSF